PALDYVRSYRTVSGQLAQALQTHVAPGECVRALGLGKGQRASFLVFNQIDFSYDSQCGLVLLQTTPRQVRDGTSAYSGAAQVLWEGKRGADRHEVFQLLRLPKP